MVSKKESRKLFKLARKMARWMRRNGVEYADVFAFSPDNHVSMLDDYKDKWFISVTANKGDMHVVEISKFLTEDEL